MKRIKWKRREFNFEAIEHNKQDLLRRLLGTEGRIRKLLNRVPEVEMELQFEGAWSIKKNIGHLMLLDQLHKIRLDELRAGKNVLTSADKKNSDTDTTDFDSVKIGKLLTDLEKGRNDLVAAFSALSETELQQKAIHPRLDQQMGALDLAYFIAEHDDHHITTIDLIIESLNFDE